MHASYVTIKVRHVNGFCIQALGGVSLAINNARICLTHACRHAKPILGPHNDYYVNMDYCMSKVIIHVNTDINACSYSACICCSYFCSSKREK